MKIFGCHQKSTTILVLYLELTVANCSTITGPIALPTTSSLRTISHPRNGTCDFRTINYITQSLPQACFRYPRSDLTGPESTPATSTEIDGTATGFASPETLGCHSDAVFSVEADKSPELGSGSALDESSFLSFEDWKKQKLEKESLLDVSASDRRQQLAKDGDQRRNSDGIQDVLNALEEDDTMETDLATFLGDGREPSQPKASQDEDDPMTQTAQYMVDDTGDDGKPRYRSKDAGKTCKERYNFASLDVGAQVMKTNPEAKSASSLLREDRDVYMLNTCQAKNKFVIVELTESILVETIAIANFEFFSSTIREFRISVSDRYPTKLDRWVDLGTFEARNSRDIQAFLVKDPRIWARYFRIEFLSHYGNEFYCPISLVRVHGRTMIQDVLNMEESTRGEDDGEEDDAGERTEVEGKKGDSEAAAAGAEEEKRLAEGLKEAEAAIENLVRTAESITAHKVQDALNSSQLTEVKQWLEDMSAMQMATPWSNAQLTPLNPFTSHPIDVCFPSDCPALHNTQQGNSAATELESLSGQDLPKGLPFFSTSSHVLPESMRLSMTENQNTAPTHSFVLNSSQGASANLTSSAEPSSSQGTLISSSIPSASGNGGEKVSSKSSITLTSHSPQPTTQESFFKIVTKRLQLLEANSTLSLKYIEEQSRILRDAFIKVERRQLAKTTSFLENLNDTVIAELQRFNQQYDQIWQSTVMELETQRDQSQREIAAVSTRLGMLADELVFQKRMSIVQSILLLLCLGLVVFSRGLAYLDQNLVARSPNGLEVPVRSSSSSRRVEPRLGQTPWLGAVHTRNRSDESTGSLRSQSLDNSPQTPFSSYSKQEEQCEDKDDFQLPQGVQRDLVGVFSQKRGNVLPVEKSNSVIWQGGEALPDEDCLADNYPDFKNSTLWLAADSLTSFPEPSERRQEIPTVYTNYSRDIPGAENQTDDKQIGGASPGSHATPFPPPEREKMEFGMARKPLPALPLDDHL